MKIQHPSLALLLGAGLLAATPLATLAADAGNLIVPRTVHGTTYLNGGVGKEEESAMHRMAKEYPLRITFSERKNDEFVVDVPVTIYDAHGKTVFELPKAGPMLYVKLPEGKYKVRARYEGRVESRTVDLAGAGGKNLYFHWTDKPSA
ncbi:MAG: carboxypeptidase regulatory-like domain-containing protein [Betaproteobacteria bacterium]